MTSQWHSWTSWQGAFFHLPFCPQAFCKDIRTNLRLSIIEKGLHERLLLIASVNTHTRMRADWLLHCHCLFNQNSRPKRRRNGAKKERGGLKAWQKKPPNTGGSDSESQLESGKAFKNTDGDWTTVRLTQTDSCTRVSVHHFKSHVAKKEPTWTYLIYHFLASLFQLLVYFFVHIVPPSRQFADKLICGEQMMICDKSCNDAKCGFCQQRSSDSLSATLLLDWQTPSFLIFSLSTLAMPKDADCSIVLLILRPFYSPPVLSSFPLLLLKWGNLRWFSPTTKTQPLRF